MTVGYMGIEHDNGSPGHLHYNGSQTMDMTMGYNENIYVIGLQGQWKLQWISSAMPLQ